MHITLVIYQYVRNFCYKMKASLFVDFREVIALLFFFFNVSLWKLSKINKLLNKRQQELHILGHFDETVKNLFDFGLFFPLYFCFIPTQIRDLAEIETFYCKFCSFIMTKKKFNMKSHSIFGYSWSHRKNKVPGGNWTSILTPVDFNPTIICPYLTPINLKYL